MKKALQIVLLVVGILCLLPVCAQTPVQHPASDLDFVVQKVEMAYAGFPNKTAGREAEYAALKERLSRAVEKGRDSRDAVAEYLGWFDDNHLSAPGVETYRPKSIRRVDMNYSKRMTSYDPQFTHCRVDGQTYLIRFPSCDLDSAQIAGVQAAADAYLASGCEHLIVDIRGNDGGRDAAYEPLLGLLYDHQGVGDGVLYRASELSIAYVDKYVGKTEWGRARVKQLKNAQPGSFLSGAAKTYAICRDSVSPLPRRAALIVDGVVASSGEQFVLDVRACSNRTTVFGQDNTSGCLDYSNCALVWFPQDTVPGMQIPVTRSFRVEDDRGIDAAGITPDVRITLPLPDELSSSVDEWVLWVAEQMKK